jgi:acyl-coenzyme A thioesterase PaaI-like protein
VTNDETRFARLSTGDMRSPLRHHVGLRYADHGAGWLVEEMHVPAWLRDDLPSAVFILADSVLLDTVSTRLRPDQAPVTNRLTFEMVARRRAADQLRAHATLLHLDDTDAVVRCEVLDDDDVIAVATAHASVVADRGSPADHSVDVAPAPAFAVEVVADGITRFAAHQAHSNSIGTLHGGAIAAYGMHAMAVALDAGPLESLVVDLLRAIPANGENVQARSAVLHVTKTRLLAACEIARADGKRAALFSANFHVA